VGIYGVLAFTVTRRSREMALRLAIGASRVDLLRLVAAESARLVLIGTVCGVGATFVLSRLARAAGGGGSMIDPDWVSFLTPVAILVLIGGVATWIPSRRALGLDPSVLLRSS
jgi:ABC-type antimicrobial peptide transport system permease subunit